MIWLREHFPWLAGGPFISVGADDVDAFQRDLEKLGFTTVTMRVADDQDVHDALAAAWSFPDYYGRNWDAFIDCVGDTDVDEHTALFWLDADRYAARDPKLFGEACALIENWRLGLSCESVQLELVLCYSHSLT